MEQMPFYDPIAVQKNFSLFPDLIGEWSSQYTVKPEDELPFNADQYVFKKYMNNEGESIYLYVGYWGKFRHGANVFSGSHLSPGFMWDTVFEKQRSVEINGIKTPVVEATFANGDQNIFLFYWYQTNQGIILKRFRGRLLHGINAIVNRETNVALVKIFSPPYPAKKYREVRANQEEFIQLIYPVLVRFLPV